MASPSLADRVLMLEERLTPLQETRRWAIAIIGGGILALAAGGMAWGVVVERLDHVAADVQELRRDLNARAQVGNDHARSRN